MSGMWRHAQTVIRFALRRLVACNCSDPSRCKSAPMNEHSAGRKPHWNPDDEDDDLQKRETPPFGGVCKPSVAASTDLAIP
jgi:hypothetical protein